MLNQLINAAGTMLTARGLKKYQIFPKKRTALLLVNCQEGFLHDQSPLKEKLENLVDFARKNNWKIIHAPYIYTERKFPTQGQLIMDQKLKELSTSKDLLYQQEGDITLQSRSTLSAFSETDLKGILRKHGLEHIVLAGPVADLTLDSTMRDGVQNDFHIAVLTDVLSFTNQSQAIKDYKHTIVRYAQTVTDLEGLKRLAEKSQD
jgi:nicotinamidase-related amidase